MSNAPKNSYFQQGQQSAQPARSHSGARAPKPNGGDTVKIAVVQGQDAYYSNSLPKPPRHGAPSKPSRQPPPGSGHNVVANPFPQGQTPSYSYSSPPNNGNGQPNYFGLNDRVEVRITTDRWVAALIIGGTAVFDKIRMAWTQQVQYQDDAAGLATRGHVGVINLENIRRPLRK
ncbi:hypothetical protein CYLTODRAFT_448136 [Cylindrobasidium torrendii FP15055 ss-10]|uniref:Uncharacterized protein n=1 Tax=Cylindrobasidium torrendii FP15055 ss-10 TaxID=1314674 RepID=A0A0D7BVV4_9AGAR|nr:hypothetical protein CYLTODRAFT_448136 [Cylindrobasidium torrendii FP15055 ss-10]